MINNGINEQVSRSFVFYSSCGVLNTKILHFIQDDGINYRTVILSNAKGLRLRKVRATTASFPHKDLSLVHNDVLKPWNLIPKKLILV